jgi:hypothetical protein
VGVSGEERDPGGGLLERVALTVERAEGVLALRLGQLIKTLNQEQLAVEVIASVLSEGRRERALRGDAAALHLHALLGEELCPTRLRERA